MNNRGFTILEIIIILCLVYLVFNFFYVGYQLKNHKFDSIGNIMSSKSDIICERGFSFVSDDRGLKQVLDEKGNGVPCQ